MYFTSRFRGTSGVGHQRVSGVIQGLHLVVLGDSEITSEGKN